MEGHIGEFKVSKSLASPVVFYFSQCMFQGLAPSAQIPLA
jgi:hypothetical protein